MGRMALTFPAPEFPVYGWSDPWDGPRWVQHVEGRGGAPILGIWLAHGHHVDPEVDAGPRLALNTSPRRRWTEVRPDLSPTDQRTEAACFAWLARGDGRSEELDAAWESAARSDEWPAATWSVDGRPVTARLVPIGRDRDTWSGFVELDDVWVVAVGRGVPTEISLSDVGDGAAYHVDLRAELTFPGTQTASQLAALGETD